LTDRIMNYLNVTPEMLEKFQRAPQREFY